MTANASYTHRRAGIVGVAAVEAPEIVTSDWIDEQLASTYERWGLRPGLLAELAGIKERRWWPDGFTFDQAAALGRSQGDRRVGRRPRRDRHADLDVGVQAPSRTVGGLRGASPTRAADLVHELRSRPTPASGSSTPCTLPPLPSMPVSSSTPSSSTARAAATPSWPRSPACSTRTQLVTDVFDEFASLTLGSGAAAMVLGSLDDHPDAHRVVGGVTRAGHRAPHAVRRRSREDDHRHQAVARRRARPGPDGVEGRVARSSTGPTGWTATSSTRSVRCTPG